jgi:aminoglycoside 2'-N-acetyltransferase I
VLATRLLATADASDELLTELRSFLVEAFAGDFAPEDWEHALGGRHAVATEDGVVVAHAAVVPRRLAVSDTELRTGYVEAVATAAGRRGRGLGARVMTAIGAVVRAEFEMGALSTGRHGFYARLGWERWRGPTFARHGAEVVRTAQDDDGVMVLRFGPSASVDLRASLTCDGRPGDDW